MPTDEELKQQQRQQWSGNAAGWDSRHDQLERETRDVSEWICREARLRPGMRVLDLSCGSGHPAINAARLVAPGGSVLATDLVPEMVDNTMKRARSLGIDNIEGRVMDAEDIQLPDAGFDAVTCRFGIMFCPQPAKAASEVLRVLKPGGYFALSVWADPQYSPAQTVVGEAMRIFGRPQPPVDYDVPGIHQLAPEGKLQRLLEGAGFRDVRVEPLHLTWQFVSQEAFMDRQGIRQGGLKALAESLPPDELSKLKAAVAEATRPYTDADGVIRLPITPLCAVARK